MSQVKPEPSLFQRNLTVVALVIGILVAIEFGLRMNDSIQTTNARPLAPDSDFTVVSFGDSVSASFPKVLERKLNQSAQPSNSRVINLYQTAPNKGVFQNTILNAISKHRPQVALIMLGTYDFGTKPSTIDLLPQSIWAKHSLLVRVLYVKFYPLLHFAKDQTQPPITDASKFKSQFADLEALVADLLDRVCCIESGSQQIADRQQDLIQFTEREPDERRTRLAAFLIQLLTHQFENARQTLSQILMEPSSSSIPIDDLEAALQIEMGHSIEALARQRQRIENTTLSEFGCSTAINASRALNDKDGENFFVQKCASQHPASVKMNFHLIDLHVRMRNRNGVMDFIRRHSQIDNSEHPLLGARIYYVIGTYFFHENELSTAIKYYEKSLELNPNHQRAVSYYLTAITNLRRARINAQIPAKLLPALVSNSRYRLFERQNGLPLTQPYPTPAPRNTGIASSGNDRSADYPLSYLTTLNQLCQSGVHTIVLNYPQQPIEPIRRGLLSVPCIQFVDLQSSIRQAINDQRISSDIFQSDAIHLTPIGDDVVATSICRAITTAFASRFPNADCQ